MSARGDVTAFDLQVMALLLRQARRLQGLSGAMMALTALWLVLAAAGVGATPGLSPWLLLASGVAGLAQGFCAARVDFDVSLLQRLDDGDVLSAARRLDASLIGLGLMSPARAGRDWHQRWQGMRRLVAYQAAWLVLQASLLAVACLAARPHGGV
ncbi:hypothetical protein N800_02350 [Lysobacter daejeonensis GH1-9]|uniref:Transmembrane protein n=1 Tax=Lysobacter daejeonensis GH1-9 TaxID=1385517 RepID=A0A0A0EXB3_9GAMM|nr:hypothetical protein [Lysobacter daejeonensis]KGM54733.1 hypothetical protein N800_02350 [Lysobacter daejeonensis GH1-9]